MGTTVTTTIRERWLLWFSLGKHSGYFVVKKQLFLKSYFEFF